VTRIYWCRQEVADAGVQPFLGAGGRTGAWKPRSRGQVVAPGAGCSPEGQCRAVESVVSAAGRIGLRLVARHFQVTGRDAAESFAHCEQSVAARWRQELVQRKLVGQFFEIKVRDIDAGLVVDLRDQQRRQPAYHHRIAIGRETNSRRIAGQELWHQPDVRGASLDAVGFGFELVVERFERIAEFHDQVEPVGRVVAIANVFDVFLGRLRPIRLIHGVEGVIQSEKCGVSTATASLTTVDDWRSDRNDNWPDPDCR